MKRTLVLVALGLLMAGPSPAHAKRKSLLINFGQDVLVAENGPVAVRAQCLQNEGGMGFDILRVYATTTSNAAMRGFNQFLGNGDYLTPMTPTTSSVVMVNAVSTGDETFSTAYDSGHLLNVATQQGFAIRADTALLGLNSGGSDCVLSVDLVPIKKFKEAK